ncbi:MAG: glycosyltransferase [Candidatus Scalindua sp.]|jgi:glycosyltransferase involved in cell wall biosynthesis|nr:glycosyltransferase [Candidatus Scalindua sp.]MBT6227536.1 glycosyltransferase [Candidatus Scalindua sp.]
MKALSLKRPLVSVVMPTYNYAQFIGDAIRSVLDQTYENIELIIIDNYSKDNTEDIVASFSDTRIKYIKFRNNGSIAASRNVGISESQGKYIAFLDSDDMWKSAKIKKQIELLEKDDNVFLVYSRYIITKDGNFLRIYPKGKKLSSGNCFVPLFLSNNFIGSCTVLMKNELKQNNFIFDTDIRLITVEDYDLWLRIAKKKRIAYIDEPLAVYRQHGNNASMGIRPLLLKNLQVTNRYRHDVNGILLMRKYLLLFMTLCLLVIKKIVSRALII